MSKARTFPGETNAEYHSDREFLSSSMIKKLREGARIFEAEYVTREKPKTESAAMKMGTAVHHACLEPDTFDDAYFVLPEGADRRTKKVKELIAENSDKIDLTWKEYEGVFRCVRGLESHPILRELLTTEGQTETELSRRWIDDETGVRCRVRADKAFIEQKIVFDIKTTAEWSPRKFVWACQDFGYHLQDAHYCSCYADAFDDSPLDWTFLFGVVETKFPYRSRVCTFDGASRMRGFTQRTMLLEDYKRRLKETDWSDPGEHEMTVLRLPELNREAAE